MLSLLMMYMYTKVSLHSWLHLRLRAVDVDASHHWHLLQFSQQHSLQLLLVQLRYVAMG